MSTLFRTTPDMGAPNSWPRPIHAIWQLGVAVLVLSTLPFNVTRYYITRTGYTTLWRYLFFRGVRTMSLLNPFLPPADTVKGASAIPRHIIGITKEMRSTINIDVVHVPPLPLADQRGFATIPPGAPVEAIDRPLYIFSSKNAFARGQEPACEGEKAIIYFHAGGYNEGHPTALPLGAKVAIRTRLRVFTPNYRKTLSTDTAYPAPLLDIMAAYKYLGDLGFSPKDIIVMGDSVGGHLTMALVTQLHELGQPMPGALAMSSPWVDLTFSYPSWSSPHDIVFKHKLKRAIRSAMRYYTPEAALHPFFSPPLAPRGTWTFLKDTPVYASYGELESFADEGKALLRGLQDDGVSVDIQVDEGGIHIEPSLAWHGPEAESRFLAGLNALVAGMDKSSGP